MNIPINHHYVSQCQIRNFFNKDEGKIFIYDKLRKNFFYKKSSKNIFSEVFLNSYGIDNIDHVSLEKDLKDNFEDCFPKNFDILKEAALSGTIGSNVKNSLIEIVKYGIVGHIRHPKAKTRIDEAVNKSFKIVDADSDITSLWKRSEGIKYSNVILYSDFADIVFKAMDNVNCILFLIDCDHYFLLPDHSSVIRRSRINDHFNPDIKDIAEVDVPLGSKLFLHSESVKLGNGNGRLTIKVLSDRQSSIIQDINRMLYLDSHKQVACENEKYLRKIISHFSTFPPVS